MRCQDQLVSGSDPSVQPVVLGRGSKIQDGKSGALHHLCFWCQPDCLWQRALIIIKHHPVIQGLTELSVSVAQLPFPLWALSGVAHMPSLAGASICFPLLK